MNKIFYKIIGIVLLLVLIILSIKIYQETKSESSQLMNEFRDIGNGMNISVHYDKSENCIGYYSIEGRQSSNINLVSSFAEKKIVPRNYFCYLCFENYDMAKYNTPPMNYVAVTNYLPNNGFYSHIPITIEAFDTMCYMEINYVPNTEDFCTEIPSIKYLVCYLNNFSENGIITKGSELGFLKSFPNLNHLTLKGLDNGDYGFEPSDENIEEIRQFIPEKCIIEF